MGLSDSPALLTSVMLAFSGGTFVYIACSEILTSEFSKPGLKIWKIVSFTLGAAFIISLWFLPGEH